MSTAAAPPSVIPSAYFWTILTAFLWGSTDPLLKYFGSKVEAKKRPTKAKHSFLKETFFELHAFFGDWKYLLAFLANQLGKRERERERVPQILSSRPKI